MTPTQAQIEAAAESLYGPNWRDFKDCYEAAQDALTAAAQVGEEDSFLFNQSTRLAAAKAADEEKQYAAALDTSKYQITNEDISTIVATTIERCAQVAEDWMKDANGPTACNVIAAAIRALKDKP